LLRKKFEVIATTAAAVCAVVNAVSTTLRLVHSTGRWTTSPSPPIKANSAKRTGIRWPIDLSGISIMYSHATSVSSLLSPWRRCRKVQGSSVTRTDRSDEARMSSGILKPWPRKPPHRVLEQLAPQHEEAAHRIGQFGAIDETAEPRRHAADLGAAGAQIAETTTGDIAAADHEIAIAAVQTFEHGREQGFVVLQVGVHHRDVGRRRRERALDAGAGKAAPADALQTAHAAVEFADRADMIGRAVLRIVIDEDHFPGDPEERGIQKASAAVRHCRARSASG
jgi:hypothetical protein